MSSPVQELSGFLEYARFHSRSLSNFLTVFRCIFHFILDSSCFLGFYCVVVVWEPVRWDCPYFTHESAFSFAVGLSVVSRSVTTEFISIQNNESG